MTLDELNFDTLYLIIPISNRQNQKSESIQFKFNLKKKQH